MEYLSFKLRCPVCNAEFSAELPSGVEAVDFDTDFRPVFAGRGAGSMRGRSGRGRPGGRVSGP